MGTSLTFHGQGTDVVLDDRTITLVTTESSSSAGEPVAILRADVTAVELVRPSLLAYGRLVISTRAGAQHTVQFPRQEQEHFENLEAIIRP